MADRIEQVAVSTSKITFRGLTGQAAGAVATAMVNGGIYEIRNLSPGTYEVSIEDASHVLHRTSSVDVPQDGLNLPFSVIGWDRGRFGATYDAKFDGFYRGIRGQQLVKWTRMPTQIYVETSGIDPNAFERVLEWIREINDESVPAMYCGLTGPIRVEAGPPLPDHTREGAIVIWFGGEQYNYCRRGNAQGPTPGSQVLTSASIHLVATNFERNAFPRQGRCVVVHELFHAAYANHSPVYRDTLMWENCIFEPQTLSAEDRLASCLVYSADTHAGNALPDTNPTYR